MTPQVPFTTYYQKDVILLQHVKLILSERVFRGVRFFETSLFYQYLQLFTPFVLILALLPTLLRSIKYMALTLVHLIILFKVTNLVIYTISNKHL